MYKYSDTETNLKSCLACGEVRQMCRFSTKIEIDRNLRIRSRDFSTRNCRFSHRPTLFCIHSALLHLLKLNTVCARYLDFCICILFAFVEKWVDFCRSRKIYAFGELIHMLGRILGWFLYQNACTSPAYAKVGWALKISEIARLKFVAWVLFLWWSLGSLS